MAPCRRLLVALLLSSALPLAAQSNQPGPVFKNGQAQVVPAFQDTTRWIHEELWVETTFDSDHDGKKDRVHVDVTRPAQSGTDGFKVPVVMGSSPYYAGTSRGQVNWDVKTELGTTPKPRGFMKSPDFVSPRPRVSRALVGEWVPRGFAVVHSEAPGTGLSSGCPTVGDTPERYAPAAVIDWLNGRAKGFTTKTGNTEVKATSWTTGKVGMIGGSYEGTLPLAAATTGVKGLEVVIPVSPNTSYYHYYRTNGLVRSPGGYLGEDVDVLYDFIASGDTAGRANCDRIWKNGIFAGSKGQD
ncbi:MAG: CocE/NonD family hydrolase, partial [Gemmatimonadales bacterium]